MRFLKDSNKGRGKSDPPRDLPISFLLLCIEGRGRDVGFSCRPWCGFSVWESGEKGVSEREREMGGRISKYTLYRYITPHTSRIRARDMREQWHEARGTQRSRKEIIFHSRFGAPFPLSLPLFPPRLARIVVIKVCVDSRVGCSYEFCMGRSSIIEAYI